MGSTSRRCPRRAPRVPIKNAFVAISPLDTQRRIARFLDEKTRQIDSLIDKMASGIAKSQIKHDSLCDLLVERRSAVITAAVTGQMEI